MDISERDIGLCWGTIHQANLVETVEAAGRHGFATLQIPPAIYFDYLEGGGSARALKRRMSDAGTSIRLVDAITEGLPGMRRDPVVFRGREMPRHDAETCIRMAEAMEAPLVNISHYLGEVTPVEAMAEAVGKICRRAAKSDITIVLEFVPDSGIRNLADAQAIVQASGEPNCSIHLDTWHLARSGGSLSELEALPLSAIGAFQLSDRIEPPSDSNYVPMTGRLLPGEGKLPLGEITRTVFARNPDLTVEVEVFSEELSTMTVGDAALRVARAVKDWRTRLASQENR